jgi:AraC-like DNA-binding protein
VSAGMSMQAPAILQMPSQMPSHVAALGWLPTSGRNTQAQLALPTDLFMVTVHCGDMLGTSGASQPALELAVTLLRTRPERFRSSAAGELAFALLAPAGLLALLRAPLEGAADRRMPLAQFCSPDELSALRDALLSEANPLLRMSLFGSWIETRIKQRHHFGAQQQRVAEAATFIQQHPGALHLVELRSVLHVSQRQLERDFRFWLGVSPAVYARLVRFQRAAMALAGGETLSDAAAGQAFADQSHMNRAFRQLSSLTPRQFVHLARPWRHAERRALAGRVVVVEAPPETGVGV